MMRTRGFGWSAHRLATIGLGATLLGLTVLLGQALYTVRAHDRVVESTMEDFAAFGAERIAAELNSIFASIFLDQIAVSRSAHYAWASDQLGDHPLPSGRLSVDPAVPTHFTIDGDRVVARGESIDPETERWLLSEVLPHAREIPRPAPYAVLRTSTSRETRAAVVRREVTADGEAVYGFLVDFRALRSVYERALRQARTVPSSLTGAIDDAELASVRIFFPQNGESLFVRDGSGPSEWVTGAAVAGKAGRIAVEVRLDTDAARALVPGATGVTSVTLFGSLAALTMALLGLVLGIERKSVALSRAREDFVANVSHDLRTPLAQIRMFTETLLLGRLHSEEERNRSLEIVHRQATQMSELVDNIVRAADPTGTPLRPEWIDVPELLGEVEDSMDFATHDAGATIETFYDGDPRAELDPSALRRILLNLIDNALKYGPRGQVVSLRVRHDGSRLAVAVDDGGSGVPKAERNRVWQRFVRARDTNPGVAGAGLGLAVVRDLATRHGGSVRIADAPSGGARVVVELACGGLG